MNPAREQMLVILTPNWRGGVAPLRALKADLDACLLSTEGIHFASLALLPPLPGADSAPSLMFEIVSDEGFRSHHLIELLVRLGFEPLWTLYGVYHDGDAMASVAERHVWLCDFLCRHCSNATGCFVGARDRSVQQIQQENELFQQVQRQRATLAVRARITPLPGSLASGSGGNSVGNSVSNLISAESLARELARWRVCQRQFDWAAQPALQSYWPARAASKKKSSFIVAVFKLLIGAVLAAPLAQWRRFERWQNRVDPVEVPRAQQVHDSIDACEAEQVAGTAHMISLTEIRAPYQWNAFWLTLVLRLIALLGRMFATQGRLGNAPGIKFGHWHIIDGNRRLLFCSNYDGSFGGYLDDFINHVPRGLNLVWRWTELQPRLAAGSGQPDVAIARAFPPTRFGIWAGVKYEQWFKSYARDSMVPHVYRFQAYRLTLADIERATRLRNALAAPRNESSDDQVLRAIES